MRVVGVERAPAAVAALHADDPFGARARSPRGSGRRSKRSSASADRGGVVEIGIMRVGVLERPAARPQIRAAAPPSRRRRRAPASPASQSSARGATPVEPRVADLHQRMAGERRIPHRRQAGLAIGALAVERRAACGSPPPRSRSSDGRRIAEAIEHHQRVRHRREDAAEPVLAVEPLGDESDGLVDRAPARRSAGNNGSATRSSRSSTTKALADRRRRSAARSSRARVSGGSTNSSAIDTPRGLRARGCIAISTRSGTRTVRDQ